MKIFQKDLEKINLVNQKVNKKNIKSNLLQNFKYQYETNRANDDLKFDLLINHKEKSKHTNNLFLNLSNNAYSSENFNNLFNLTTHQEIFESLERILLQYGIEKNKSFDNFDNNFNIKFNEKDSNLDFLQNFLLEFTKDNQNLNFLYSMQKEFNSNAELKNYFNNNIKTDIITFFKKHLGFNFLNTTLIGGQYRTITNFNKQLSSNILLTSLNNIINTSLDFLSCNTLFTNIYNDNQLFAQNDDYTLNTNCLLLEHDYHKEIIPIKYTSNLELIKEREIKEAIDYINATNSTDNRISNDIFSNNKYLNTDQTDSPQYYMNTLRADFDDDEYSLTDNLPSSIFFNKIVTGRNVLQNFHTKDKNDYFVGLSLIANHLKSDQLDLVYYDRQDRQLKRSILNDSGKGLFNYQFEDNDKLYKSIIKNRLRCNHIVKLYKKIILNNSNEVTNNSTLNRFKFLFQNNTNNTILNNTARSNINLINNIADVLNQQQQSITEKLLNFSFFNDMSENFNNKPNFDLFVMQSDNDTLLFGEKNIPLNLNYQSSSKVINDLNKTSDINNVEAFNDRKATVKQIIDSYYDVGLGIFKDTNTFFEEITKICDENINNLLVQENKAQSDCRADILQQAAILWLFNDEIQRSNTDKNKKFKDDFINHLIAAALIKSGTPTIQKALKDSLFNLMSTSGPDEYTVTELSPFFIFNVKNNNILRDRERGIEYYNITKDIFDTHGRFEHFLSIPTKMIELTNSISTYIPHQFSVISFQDENLSAYKRIFPIAGTHKIEFIDDTQMKVAKNFEGKPRLKVRYENNKIFFKIINENNLFRQDLFFLDFSSDIIDLLNSNQGNNIFSKLISLFGNVLSKINIQSQTNDINSLISNFANDSNIKNVKSLLLNTLELTSKIYTKMFNNLQSYCNLSDRIIESNCFFHNGIEQSTLNYFGKHLNRTDPDIFSVYDSFYNNQESSLIGLFNDLSSSANDFIRNNNQNQNSNFKLPSELNRIWDNYQSLSSKKMIYFLYDVLGIKNTAILNIIMETLLKQEIPVFREGYFSDLGRVTRKYTNISNENLQGIFSQDTDLNSNEWGELGLGNKFTMNMNPFEIFYTSSFELYKILNLFPTLNDNRCENIFTVFDFNLTTFSYFFEINRIRKSTQDLDSQQVIAQTDYVLKRYTDPNDFIYYTYVDIDNEVGIYPNFQRKNGDSNEFVGITIPKTKRTRDLVASKKAFDLIDYSKISEVILENSASAEFISASDTLRFIDTFNSNTSGRFDNVNAESTSDSFFSSHSGWEVEFDFNMQKRFSLYTHTQGNRDEKDFKVRAFENIYDKKIRTVLSPQNILYAFNSNTFKSKRNYQMLNDVGIKSGIETDRYTNDYLGIKSYLSSKNLSNEVRKDTRITGIYQDIYNKLTNNKYNFFDINSNWYNHILYGLYNNDISLALSFDIVYFYLSKYQENIKNIYNQLSRKRSTLINGLNVQQSIEKIKSHIENNSASDPAKIHDDFFMLDENNLELQNAYLSSLIKYKSIKNVSDIKDVRFFMRDGFKSNSITNDIVTTNGKGDLIMHYFTDFSIEQYYNQYQNNHDIFKNYERYINDNVKIVNNQALYFNNSNLLTIGIDNQYKLDINDIIIVKVEMIDHDFPEIIWEPKIFEFYNQFDDINDIFLQYPELFSGNSTELSSIDKINLSDIPIKIMSHFENEKENTSLKDLLIKNVNKIDQIVNLTNNINSLTYDKITINNYYIPLRSAFTTQRPDADDNFSIIQPIIYQNDENKIIRYLLDSERIKNLADKLINENLTFLNNDQIELLLSDFIKRCIHNQKLNFKFKKLSKLLTGFESDIYFSLKNKGLKHRLISSAVYDIFTKNIDLYSKYGIVYDDFIKCINLNQINYNSKFFHTANMSSDFKINNLIDMMCQFTIATSPDYSAFIEKKFQKVLNICVNSEDFIVAGSKGSDFFKPKISDNRLKFDPISNVTGVSGFNYSNRFELGSNNIDIQYYDEIGTNPNLIFDIIMNNINPDNKIVYYNVLLNADDSKYKPKNITYRITTTILK